MIDTPIASLCDVMPPSAPPAATPLSARAAADPRFIRSTMAEAGTFTALSGVGFMLVGAGALACGVLALTRSDPVEILCLWLADAALSIVIGVVTTARKARRTGRALFSGPLRKFALGFAPPVVAGAVLTAVFAGRGNAADLPAVWLLCYGAGLVSAGAFSVPTVPLMGLAFMAVGVGAALAPSFGPAAMLAGFGVLYVVFGGVLARRHGG